MPNQQCYFCNSSISLATASCPTCHQPLFFRERYQLVGVLGRGGFGIVYEAIDALQRRCAIKVISATSLSEQRQIETEARILAQYSPVFAFMPQIYDLWIEQSQTFLVMEYIEGQTLDALLAQPWSAARVEQCLRTLLSHLSAMHDAGIVHRDLKPDNIKLTPQGTYVLLDFGIAKHGTTTRTVAKAMSPDYASFEQFMGQPTDNRSDLYSLASTMYHLLTGLPPARAIARAAGTKLIPPSSRVPCSAELEHVLLAMLQLDPSERPADAQAALCMLDQAPKVTLPLLSTGVRGEQTLVAVDDARPVAVVSEHDRRPVMRRRWLISVGVGLVFILLAARFGLQSSVSDPSSRPSSISATAVPREQKPEPPRNATASPGYDDPTLITSPASTQRLAFFQIYPTGNDPFHELYVISSDGQRRMQVYSIPWPNQIDYSWSPDGRRIAYTAENAVNIIQPLGNFKVSVFPWAESYLPAWSPDGQRIAFTVKRGDDYDIKVVNPDEPNSEIRRLANGSDPRWSPDGRYLAYQRQTDEGLNIYTISADGTHETRLTTTRPTQGVDSSPLWSPDGRRLAFNSVRGGNAVGAQVYLINADGSGETRLTDSAQFNGAWVAGWSPDGQRILFIGERRGNIDIYTISPDGSNLKQLTNDSARETYPVWSTDGSQIAFISTPKTDLDYIYIMNADGSAKTRLTNDSRSKYGLKWVP